MTLRELPTDAKRRLPFRLGSTSYVVPDAILPNVRVLAPIVDDIELVLFETPGADNMPSAEDVRTLRRIADDHGLSYTVHLPTDQRAGASDDAERARYVDAVRRVMDLCRDLAPYAWVAHLDGVARDADGAAREAWAGRCAESLHAVRAAAGNAPLAVENLGYPWQWHAQLADVALCCDVGHLWCHFADTWQQDVAAMLPRTRVIHLHGVADGRDHIALDRADPAWRAAFFAALRQARYAGVVTLEVFSEHDFVTSFLSVQAECAGA